MESRFPAAVAVIVAISLLLAAVLMSATVPGGLGAGALGGGGGMDLPGGGGGSDEGQRGEEGEGGDEGDAGDARPGSGSPAEGGREGERLAGEGRRGPGATGTFDPTTVGDVPGPGHLTDGDGAVILSFTVESIAAEYYRFAAYDEYTGAGWRRTGDTRPYDGKLPYPEGDFAAIAQDFQAERRIAVMPAAWKPRSVHPDDRNDTLVTSQDGLRPAEPFEPGDRYRVNSLRPLVSPEGLNRTGRDYPEAIVSQYTKLPNATPARVETLADRVTADAETPYEETVAVGAWLRENKGFSLNATYPGGPVADAFLFEMDAGYCEYFATAMVAMLRSQGVPARYVVGYTPGPELGDDTYYLFSAQSHAWVEVYFEGQGWVRFDPTPRELRLGAEERAFERTAARLADDRDRIGYRSAEAVTRAANRDWVGDADGSGPSRLGGPVDRIGRPGSAGQAQTPTPTPTPSPTADYDVRLDRRPVPGASVIVTVTDDGEPQSGATVLFNDEPVGVTDERGRVVAMVPYDDTLVVDVRAAAERSSGSLAAPGVVGATAWVSRVALGTRASLAATGGDLPPSGGAILASPAIDRSATDPRQPNASPRTYELNTTAEVRVSGPRREGASVTTVAVVEGVPVHGANVSVDGRLVGTTDGDGRLSMELPYREAVTVTVARGAVAGSRDLRLKPTINVSVVGHPIPGTDVTVRASRHGSPVGGAAVAVDGTRVGTTAADGTLRVTVPVENTVDLAVRSGDARGSLRLGWLFAWFLLPTGGVAAVLLAGAAYRRYGRAARRRAARLPGLVRRFLAVLAALTDRGFDAVVAALVAGAAAGVRALALLRVAAVATARRLRSAAAWLGAAVRSFVSRIDSPVALVWWLLGVVRSLPRRALRRLRSGRVDDDAGEETGRSVGSTEAGATPLSVRAAWLSFVGMLGVDSRTKTPGELADLAVEMGFPSGPVRRLTDVYRAVRYGGREEDRRSRRRAGSALASIAERLRGGGR